VMEVMDVLQATPVPQWRSKRHRMTTAASSLAGRLALVSTLGLGALVGCTASADDVKPPANQLYFPSGIVVSPDQSTLFVANANSELRYDSGSISVIRLAEVQSVIDAWRPVALSVDPPTPDGCARDLDHRETLVCDAARFIDDSAGVRVGNFATDIALQNFTTGGGPANFRLVVPTRGDPSITWIDYVNDKLSCTVNDGVYDLCDDSHRLTSVHNDLELPSIPNEPFGVFADPGPGTGFGGGGGYAMVTHLTNGAVTLIESPSDGPARIIDIKTNLFAADFATGIRAATAIAGRTPGSRDNIVYVGSRTDNRIQTFTVAQVASDPTQSDQPRPAYLLAGDFFFLNAVGGPSNGNSSDTRSMQFSANGERLYVVNRDPPSLQVYDTSLLPTGVPSNTALGASDICRQASTATVLGDGDDERAYVTCFQDGQVYVVDPRGQSQVEDIITVGRGPYSIAAVKDRSQLFISNFLEDTLAVVDVAPGSPIRNRVVLRIGKPRAL
jgi:DNA-binding beta-propeller fold protein YncE